MRIGFLSLFGTRSGYDVAAAQIREAADDAEHFVELVGPFPGDREGRNRAGTCAADAVVLGILRRCCTPCRAPAAARRR